MLHVKINDGPTSDKVIKAITEEGNYKDVLAVQFAGQVDYVEVDITSQVRDGVFKGTTKLDGKNVDIQFTL